MDDGGQFSTAARLLVVGASFVVVVAGMKAAASILTPLLLAVFLALLCLPAVRWLHRHKVPDAIGIPVVLLVALLIGGFLLSILGGSVQQFIGDAGEYEELFREKAQAVRGWMEEHKLVDLDEKEESWWDENVNPARILSFIGTALGQLSSILSNLALILLLLVFLLFELLALPRKLQAMHPEAEDRGQFERIVKSVNRYITIKTVLSLATGASAGILCAIVGVRYPVLWGMTAFLLNYIPNIGSILAAIPPVLLAFILPDLGIGASLIVAGGYVGINMVIGNVIEPRMMGRSLDLSTLVVFISMVFWGWVFGPVGMFLSVPLTMVVKIALESSETTKPLAILLGTEPESAAE
ncbi:MAG: AI-2E family transporter [Planctomycetota bacterium]|jgi:predicted PurR-regulated permease PerM